MIVIALTQKGWKGYAGMCVLQHTEKVRHKTAMNKKEKK